MKRRPAMRGARGEFLQSLGIVVGVPPRLFIHQREKKVTYIEGSGIRIVLLT